MRPAHWRRVRAAIAPRRCRRALAGSWRVSLALPTFRHRAFSTAQRLHSLYVRPGPDSAAQCDRRLRYPSRLGVPNRGVLALTLASVTGSDMRAGSFTGIWRTAGWFEAACVAD